MTIKSKRELIASLKKAADDDTLMTPIHDPNKMDKTSKFYRTVLGNETPVPQLVVPALVQFL
jgi:hypothetical protein